MPGRTNLTILAALTLAAGLISPLALAIDGTADPASGAIRPTLGGPSPCPPR